MELLTELNSPHIQVIRGQGLLVGAEMDIDVNPVVDQAYDKGLLVVSAGTNILRFVPPLVITHEELEQAVMHVGGHSENAVGPGLDTARPGSAQ